MNPEPYAAGFWQAPRWLPGLLEDGTLTPSEYAIVNYVAQVGADRPRGTRSTRGELAGLFGVSEKTVSRALRTLADLELVEHDLSRGKRRPIRISLGARFGSRLRTSPRSLETEVVSEVTSDTQTQGTAKDPTPQAGSRRSPTSDTSRARADRDLSLYVTTARSVYLGAGGSLDLDEWREPLERHALRLGRRRVPLELVSAAAARLGRERGFPGYLSQRVAELEDAGGVCRWQGLQRHALTADQLRECQCNQCRAWAERSGERVTDGRVVAA